MGRHLLPCFEEMDSGEKESSVCSPVIDDGLPGSGAMPCPQEAPKHGANTAAPIPLRLLGAPETQATALGGSPLMSATRAEL